MAFRDPSDFWPGPDNHDQRGPIALWEEYQMRVSGMKMLAAASLATLIGSTASRADEINFWMSEPGKAKAQTLITEFERERS